MSCRKYKKKYHEEEERTERGRVRGMSSDLISKSKYQSKNTVSKKKAGRLAF